MSDTVVDPRVSRAKFDREVAQYRQLEPDYIRRGWWMMRATFPEVLVVFATDKTQPPAVVFGALIDFTNYDLWAPSVKLINPFTLVPYKAKELPSWLLRKVPVQVNTPEPGVAANPTSPTDGEKLTNPTAPLVPTAPAQLFVHQPMMQTWGPDEVPFLCLPGVKEYHESPAHSGDSWLLHRGRGEGTLHFILDQLYRYGVQPMRVGIQVQVSFQPAAEEVPT